MDSIIGQQQAKDIINAALQSGRMHHAWILHGPQGVGKFTTAMRLARILLDPDAAPNLMGQIEANPGSESTQLIDSPEGAHPDLHVINKELASFSDDANMRKRKQSTIPVQIIRQHLIEEAYKTSRLRHGKVFIVDEAELLAREGQNAMLKTLEEPPDGTFLFLICTNEERLLPTIRSRCQRISFQLLHEGQVTDWVEKRMMQEDAPQLNTQQVKWLITFARGSLGRAELAMNYGLFTWQERLMPMLNDVTNGRLAPGMGDAMESMAKDFSEAWVKAHPQASKDAANKAALGHLLGLIGHNCRQAMAGLIKSNGDLDPAELELKLQPWLVGIDLVQTADSYLSRNVNSALVLDNLAIQWKQKVKDGVMV